MTLPKLVDLDRVIVFKLFDDDPSKFNAELFYNHVINFGEVRLLQDAIDKDVSIFDMTGVKLTHLLRAPPVLIHKVQVVIEKVFSTRVRAFHVVNGFEALLNGMKTVLKPKLRERVRTMLTW